MSKPPEKDPPEVQLFTDGGCSGNPGPGGLAFLLRHPASGKELERFGAEAETTNNRMELMAVICGLESLRHAGILDENPPGLPQERNTGNPREAHGPDRSSARCRAASAGRL